MPNTINDIGNTNVINLNSNIFNLFDIHKYTKNYRYSQIILWKFYNVLIINEIHINKKPPNHSEMGVTKIKVW